MMSLLSRNKNYQKLVYIKCVFRSFLSLFCCYLTKNINLENGGFLLITSLYRTQSKGFYSDFITKYI